MQTNRYLNLIVLTVMLFTAIPFSPSSAAPSPDPHPLPPNSALLPAWYTTPPTAPDPISPIDTLPAPTTDNPAAPDQDLSDTPDWTSHEADDVRAMAVGDFDLDGDLDLATAASDAPVRVFINDGGTLPVNASWTAPYTETAYSIAWADVNGDGYLDLAVGNDGVNRLYVYSPTLGSLVAAWQSAETEFTRDLAWADWDGDGDPDLAVGNDGQANRVYRNNDGTLIPAWHSGETDATHAVAWGDWDDDDDMDLAVGNFGDLRVYGNTGGAFTTGYWEGGLDVHSVAWADFNEDGNFDLAVGTISDTLVYSATGSDLGLYWSYEGEAVSVAWEDWNSDDELDLATTGSGGTKVFAGRMWGNVPAWTGPAGNCIIWGDFNTDLLPDLMLGHSYAVKYRGKLQSSVDISLAWTSAENDNTNSVAWGDWDGDGDPDLAVGNYYQPNRVYRNDGGTLALAWTSAESDGTISVAWGDWDGDGDPDLAVGSYDPSVYRNDGGTLTLAWTSAEGDSTESVAWGDWDGDGNPDLAVGNNRGSINQPNRVYRNDGGTLTLAWSSTERDRTKSVAWGDWDGDGVPDLVVGNGNQPNRVYRNDGGTLSLAWSSVENDETYSVAWGDWDGDGDPDLAVGNNNQPNRVYRNDGGTLTLAWTSAESDGTISVAWGDWDGDGVPDLAVGNFWDFNRVYRNDGGTLTMAWTSAERDRTKSVAWGDWDGDGDPDLAGGNDHPNCVYRNDGGALTMAWRSTARDNTRSVAWGDTDSDGDLDLAAGNWGQPVRVYRRDLDIFDPEWSTMTLAWSAPSGNNTHDLAWTDWDSDSDLDLAVGNNGVNQLYENVSSSEISLTLVWSSPENEDTRALAWGDWDGDGDLDLAAGNYDQPNRLYHNAGGTLTTAWSSLESDQTQNLAWGDYDDDSDPDLAVGNDGQPNRVYRNDGNDFTLVWSSAETDNTDSIAWADYDGDGDLDMLAGNDGQPNWGYRNDGGDTFVRAWNLSEWDNTHSIEWGDWDSDGDLDVIAGNGGNPNRVYRNTNGDLGAYAAWNSPDVDDTYDTAWGDWDNDGDLDVAVGNYGQVNRVYESHLHVSPSLPNSPARALVRSQDGTLDGTAVAPGIHSAVVLNTPVITIPFQLFDDQADPVHHVDAYYSLHGGGQWLPATVIDIKDEGLESRLTNLETSTDPEYGQAYYLLWDALADGVRRSDNVSFRIVPHSDYRRGGLVTRPPYGANSYPFRVHIADLSPSTCAVEPAVAPPGSLLTYTLVLSNADPLPAPGVDVAWALAEHTTFITTTASQGEPVVLYTDQDHQGQPGYETGIRWQGTITPSGQVTITVLAQLDAPLPDGTQVVATAMRNGQPLCEGSMAVTVRSAPDFTLSGLYATPTRAQPTKLVTYTAVLANHGDMHVPLAVYSDTLPANATWVGNVQITPPGAGATGYADGVFQWMGPLTVGLPVTISYQVQLDNLLPIGMQITNTATVNDGITNTVTLTAPAVTIYSEPTLDTSTLDAPARVRPGDPLTYALRLENAGTMHAPSSSASGALPSGTTCTGDFWASAGNGGCAGGTVSWSGPLTVGLPVTVSYVAQVGSGLSAGTVLSHAVTVTPQDFVTATITRTVVTTVAVPNLGGSQLVVDKPIIPLGETVALTLTLRNADIDAPQITVLVPIPAYLHSVSDLTGGASYNAAQKQVEWNGPLAEGATTQLGFRAVVSDTAPPDHTIVVTATIDDGYNPGLERGVTIRAGVSDLWYTIKTVDRPFVRVGRAATYTLALINANSVDANATLTDPLPADISFVSASPGLAYNAGEHRLEWSGVITGNSSITMTCVVSVSSALSDGIPIANVMYLDDGAGYVYTRTATLVTVRPQDSDCVNQVCVYADTRTDLGGGRWRFSGRVRVGSPSRADVFLDEDVGGHVILDETNGTITGEGRLSLLANRLYPVLDGPFDVTPDTGLVTLGPDASYLFDNLSGFTVPTDTVGVTVNVLQGTLSGTAQIESHVDGLLDISTQVDFFVNNGGSVDAVVGPTDFNVGGLPTSIDGGYLDSYGLVLNPELTLPMGITVSIPTCYVYPDGVFAGYVEFEQPVAVNLGGWGVAYYDMVLDSDHGLLFPTSIITLPGGTTALLTDLYVNTDGTIAYGNIQGDFQFEIAGVSLAAHNATLSDAGLHVISATLSFPFPLTPDSDPLALTFTDLLIAADGSIQSGGLSMSEFDFDFLGWQLHATGLILDENGVRIPQADLTFPTQPVDLGGRTYHFANVGVTPDGHLYGSLTDPQRLDIGDWRADATQGFTLSDAGVCAPEISVALPYYLGRTTLYFSDVCLDPATGVKAGSLSADFRFGVRGWSLEASKATLVGEELHVLTTTLTIPALDSTQVQIHDLQLSYRSPYILGGSFATDVQASLFGLQVRIPYDKISLARQGVEIQELTLRLPSDLYDQEITLTNLNASPDKITLRSNLGFEVAGLTVEARNSTLSSGGFHAGRAKLSLPASLGNYRTNINNVRINASGLTIDGGNVDIRLPSFNVGGGSGLGIREARVRLTFDSGGYLFDGRADIAVPGMMSVDCRVVFGTPDPPTWRYELREASVHIYGGGFRIPVDATGIFITGIEGKVRLSDPIRFDLIFDYESAPSWIVHGRVGGWVDTWGQFGIQGSALALNEYIQATMEASITRARGLMSEYDFCTKDRVLEGNVSVNIWSSDGRTHFTASGRLTLRLPKGLLGRWELCIDVPELKCGCDGEWWEVWKCWCKIRMKRHCWGTAIPPNDITLARLGVDLGEFKNGRWGAKGTVEFFGIRFGLYIDTSGHIDVTNLDSYELLEPPRRMALLSTASSVDEQYVEVKDDSEGIIFAMGWYTGTPTLALVSPSGNVITPTVAASDPLIHYEAYTDTHQVLYAVQEPQPGSWHLLVENPPAQDHYHLMVIGASAFSTVTVETPAAAETPADPTITIQGQVGGAYTDTVLSLYTIVTPTAELLVSDENGITTTETITVYSGRLLAEDVPLNPDGSWSYVWNTAQNPRPAGVYHVYASVEDERHPPVHAYAPGSIRVVDDTPPAPPAHLVVTPDENELGLNWAANTEPDLWGYRVYYRTLTDTSIITYTSSFVTYTGTISDPVFITGTRIITEHRGLTATVDVGDVTHITLPGLDNGLFYFVGVSAYDLSGNESALNTASAVVTETAPVVCNTPVTLEAPPVQEIVAGETALVTITARTTAPSMGNMCDFVQLDGGAVISGTASVYLEQESLYLFAQGNHASVQAHLYAPPDVPPGDYTVIFSGTVGSKSSSASTVLHIVPGPAYTITLTPDQSGIPGDGVSSTIITTTVTDRRGYPVADGTLVEFSTDAGALSPTQTQTVNGVAQATLTSNANGPVTATVTAKAGDAQGESGVAFLWADLIIAEAQPVRTYVQPGGMAQFRFAFGNAGNKVALDVVINAVLPNGLSFVRPNSLGLSPQQTGDTPYVGLLTVIDPGAAGIITITTQVDSDHNWEVGDRITVPLEIASLDAGQDFSLDNNAGQVVFVIGEPPGTSSVYLPLVLRNWGPPQPYPLIEQSIPEIITRPVTEQGETFYTTTLSLDGEIPAGGQFYFSSDPHQVLSIMVDDQLVLIQDYSEIFSYTFSSEGVPPEPAIVEISRQVVEAIADGNVILEYQDVYGSVVSASKVWLIWAP
ncbi:MAG: DUF11 domain-containing protein [Chloroflexi bacterium]|nr:DUF11 domain-containing protein [Chloroflexota bacterium]